MDSERPIEKRLREYARSRRERQGAAPELHPATRRLLRGEVARTYRPDRGESSGRSWVVRIPKFAWGLVVVALAGLVWMFAPDTPRTASTERPTELALSREADMSQPAPPTNAAELTSAPADMTFRQDQAALLAAGGRADTQSGVGAARFTRSAPARGTPPSTEPAARSTTPPPPAAAPAVAALNSVDRPQNATALMFLNQAPGAFTKQPDPAASNKAAVLANFRVDQQGDQLRIVDSDGSVYAGVVQPLTTTTIAARAEPAFTRRTQPRSAAETPPAPMKSDASDTPTQNYAFEVIGTNVSLQQRVVFNGVLLDTATVNVATNARFGIGNALAQNVSNFQNFSTRPRISRRRRIEGSAAKPSSVRHRKCPSMPFRRLN